MSRKRFMIRLYHMMIISDKHPTKTTKKSFLSEKLYWTYNLYALCTVMLPCVFAKQHTVMQHLQSSS